MLYDPKWEQKTKTKPATALLIAARKLIEKRENWCQRSFEDGKARCMYGAILQASLGMGNDSPVFRAAEKYLCRQVHNGAIVSFNDDRGRKHAEVLAVFDAAIEASR